MKFNVLTLFPEMIRNGLETSIIGRALDKNIIELNTVNIREFSLDKHGKVDDYTYGGGAGMLIQAQPVYDAWSACVEGWQGRAETDGDGTTIPKTAGRPRTIYVTPQGKVFSQAYAAELAKEEELIFLCGHYEGIDQRVLDEIVTDYVSIGDYVLTGGELPVMVMIDAIARLVPGVLHNEESAQTESFHRNLLEYPQYSRPEIWHAQKVPEVLLTGDHRKIAAWRLEQSKLLTKRRRPDLYAEFELQETVIGQLSKEKRLHIHMIESLRRGRGEILFRKGQAVCVYDPECEFAMFATGAKTKDPAREQTDCAGEVQLLDEMITAVPADVRQKMRYAVATDKSVCERWNLAFPGEAVHQITEFRIACYTQRNVLPVRFQEIRLVQEQDLDRLICAHSGISQEVLADRIRAKALFGAFSDDGKLIGTAGWYADGSLGFLYVEAVYRRRGIGSSLEAYCINRQLELGYVPYGYLAVEDTVMPALQEKLGLYLSRGSVWKLER